MIKITAAPGEEKVGELLESFLKKVPGAKKAKSSRKSHPFVIEIPSASGKVVIDCATSMRGLFSLGVEWVDSEDGFEWNLSIVDLMCLKGVPRTIRHPDLRKDEEKLIPQDLVKTFNKVYKVIKPIFYKAFENCEEKK